MILNQFTLEKAVRKTFTNIPKDAGANMRKRHRNAINKAFDRLLENPFISYENEKLLILSDTKTEKGEAKFYETSKQECRLIEPGNALCHAFWEGFPCWHRATLGIVENYLQLLEESKSKKTNSTVHAVNT